MAVYSYDAGLLEDVQRYLQSADQINPLKSSPTGYNLFIFPGSPTNSYDEVYPGIVIGDKTLACNKEKLKEMGITHVVNMCMGSKYNMIDTHSAYFSDVNITFIGFPAKDIFTYNLAKHFEPAVDFIDKALAENGKIYVHCQQGISRSATVVLAFLMKRRGTSLMEAVKAVRAKREIFPNDGFLKLLCELNSKLYEK